MKCQGNYEGTLPTLSVIKEGSLLRIFYDYQDIPVTEEDGDIQKYLCENVDVEGTSYADIVSAIIRSMYSQESVEAIMVNYTVAKDTASPITEAKRAEYIDEYNGYQAFREKAKQIADSVISNL